jgi:metal-responsive CopG/Arc/MetJ family transcriptional regulator
MIVDTMAKEKTGVSIKEETLAEIDAVVDESDELEPTRSEAVDAILTAFVNSEEDTFASTRELIIKNRKGKL